MCVTTRTVIVCILLLLSSIAVTECCCGFAAFDSSQQRWQQDDDRDYRCCRFKYERPPTTTATQLNVVPLKDVADATKINSNSNAFTFLEEHSKQKKVLFDASSKMMKDDDASNCYTIGVIDDADIINVADFVVKSFGADVISLSSDIASSKSFERAILTPAVSLVNGYSGFVAFAEVLTGIRTRVSKRLQPYNAYLQQQEQSSATEKNEALVSLVAKPNLNDNGDDANMSAKMDIASKTSIVLIVTNNTSNDNNNIVASIELQLQPCDAKIPFTLPFIDGIERRIASLFTKNKVGGKNSSQLLQPYLSNLCVSPMLQGRGIGRALCQCIENIVQTQWTEYDTIYLHVDPDNKPAWALYLSEGYTDAGRRWKPFWSGTSSSIGYLQKKVS